MSESVRNLNEIVEKLHEVDNVFKFGKKMIPVLEGFVSFITDFIPFVEQVSGSIQDTRSKMPEASMQLDNVTSATELAMTEVLDKIDEISVQLESIDDSMNELIEKRVTTHEMLDNLRTEVRGYEKAEELVANISDNIDIELTFEVVKNKIKEISGNTDQITLSLQVQDITAQQLAAVNHLIISVQQKLGGLLSAVDETGYEVGVDLEHKKLPDVHFDANASYSLDKNQQAEVDSIVNGEKTSQEDIDKLFS